MEDKKVVTMQGNPLTLAGTAVEVGQSAPDCELIANNLATVKLSSFKGKVCLISSVPSLDTSVCSIQSKTFGQKAAALGKDVAVLTISMDLPFAQARWCGAAGADNVQTLSDYRYAQFGQSYGLLIKELRLLARAVLIIDAEGIIRYFRIVDEITNEPDYDKAIKALKGIT